MNSDPKYNIPISNIKRDKKLILEYHACKEPARKQHRHFNRFDYTEEALDYSIVIHDLFGIDYKCKECVARSTCCRFSNFDKFENNGECDGIYQLLNANIIKDIEDYYYDEREHNIDNYLDDYLLGW